MCIRDRAGRAADPLEERELLAGLDTLRDHGDAQPFPQSHEGSDQVGAAVPARQAADERTVDLERVDREPVQGVQAGAQPGAESSDVEPQPGVCLLYTSPSPRD